MKGYSNTYQWLVYYYKHNGKIFTTGYCVEKNIKHPSYIVHSMNPIGKQNIESYINSYNKTL